MTYELAAALKTLENLNYTYHGAELWKPPLGKAPDYITKPIFTQAMQEAGELPPIGSEAVCCYTDEVHKIIGHDLFHEDGHYALVCDDTGYWGAEACRWSPIEPPIELIDFQPYLFRLNGQKIGFYREDRKSFFTEMHGGNKICGENEPVKIQLLEVK